MLIRILGCVGLANLLLLVEWQSLGAVYDRDLAYFENIRHPLTYVWSTALAVLAICAGLTAASLLLDALRQWRRTRAIDRMVLGLTALVLVEVWLCATASLLSWKTRVRVGEGMALVAIWCVVRLPSSSTLAVGSRLLAWTGMLFPIFLLSTLIRSANYPLPAPVQRAERDTVPIAANRVVWVVLDEFDATVAFDRRPSTLHLPNIDRLRAESFVATRAYAPGAWTLDAMPTLWTGRPVTDAREAGPSDLRLTFVDDIEQHTLADTPTVFSRARSAGLRVGIAGWYHPYCRLFGAVAEPCEAAPAGDANFAFRRAAFATRLGTLAMVPRLVSWHALWSREAIMSGGLTRARTVAEQSLMVSYRAGVYARVHRRSLEMARDPSLSLVFAHYPIPHLPGLYDRDRGEIDVMSSRSYWDNLALADRVVGDLRRALEEAGLWATTTLLVHSDHAVRPEVWRSLGLWTPELEAATGGRQSVFTPFVLKLADQREPVAYEQPFSAALAHDLVLALLAGRLRGPTEVTAWLDANRGRLPLSWHVTTLADR